MKRNLFAILLALTLVVALAFVVAPTAQADAAVYKLDPPADPKVTVTVNYTDVAGKVLDLNGNDVEIDIPETGIVYVIDSAIKGADGAGAGSLKNTGTGKIAIEAEDASAKRFLKVPNDDGTYSFHPFYLTIKQTGVNTNKGALCLQIMLVTTEKAYAKIDAKSVIYGECDNGEAWSSEALKKDEDGVQVAEDAGQLPIENGVMYAYYNLIGSLADDEAIAKVKSFRAFITVGGETVYSKHIETVSPKTVLEKLNEQAHTFSETLKEKMADMVVSKPDAIKFCKNFLSGATLSFEDATNRKESSTTQQLWRKAGIVFTYDKNTYSNNLAEYSPIRIYGGTSVTIAYPGMTHLDFVCEEAKYAEPLAALFSDYNVTVDGVNVSVELTEASDSITFYPDVQVRIASLDVSVAPLCQHKGGTATCQAKPICELCGASYGKKSDSCIDDNYDHICDLGCADTFVGECGDGDDDDTLCDYGANHIDGCKKDSSSKTPYNATISFASTAHRKSQDSEQQIWESGLLTFTNDRAESSTPIANYSNPIRLYQGTTVTIAAPGMTQIVITSNGTTKYKTALANSLEGAGITYTNSGNNYTITLNGENSITFALTAQARLVSITVNGNN